MESCTQLVQKFAHVADHAQLCYDFDLQGNLDKFMRIERDHTNFSEAAFMIYDASRIYGRKVDYFEQTLLDFNKRNGSNIARTRAEFEAAREKDMAEAVEKEKNAAEKKDIDPDIVESTYRAMISGFIELELKVHKETS